MSESEAITWMMGWEDDWIEGAPYNAKRKMLGNGVVPQQAELALQLLDQRPGPNVSYRTDN